MSQATPSPDRRALLEDALRAVEKMQARLEASERTKREPIAIVGMGCRFPGGANTPSDHWRLLCDGADATSDVPRNRWDAGAYYDPDPKAPGKMVTPRGGFLDRVDTFDAGFFGISPREATTLDPQQRLLLEVAWETLEDAGQAPDRLHRSSTGVFIGITALEYARVVGVGEPGQEEVYAVSGNMLNTAAGRVSFVLGLQGPCVAVDTACSSSLVAVHLASQSLRNGECDLALAGGVNVILLPEASILLSKWGMLAPDGRCKAFDAAADGFVRSEGCGVVALKRLSSALAGGDRILALIVGSAVNHDGRSSGLTVPNGLAQQAVLRKALTEAAVDPSEVGYVEAHGTGTSLGDPIEVEALAAVMDRGRPANQPLLIGSVKSNMGHLEAAAGIAGLIKVVLALQHEEIPPHLHLREPNPRIPWKDYRIAVPTRRTPWPRGSRRRIAGVSSFGMSGTNAHAVLQEAPLPEVRESSVKRPLHVLGLSGKTRAALQATAERLATHLITHPKEKLPDVAFTANVGRAHLPFRAAVIGGSTAETRERLAAIGAGRETTGAILGHGKSVEGLGLAFLFTGQGGQYVGMGRQLYETSPKFRKALERCDELLRPHLAQPLLSMLYPKEGEASSLDETVYTQPALFALEYALAELWRSWGVEPRAVLGHSVGEYVAACVAGVFSLEDGLRLIAARGRLMQALPPGGEMTAVFADEARVTAAIAPYASSVSLAAINGPESVVISGEGGAVREVTGHLAAEGIKSTRLTVSHAFHSPLMEPMLAEFARVAAGVRYTAPRLELLSNRTGQVVEAGEIDAAHWVRHLREAVRFQAGMEALQGLGYELFLEVGPSPTLLGMGRRCLPEGYGVWLPTLRQGRSDWEQVLTSLGELYVRGADVDWAGFDRDYPRRKVALPTYPFQRERYWIEGARPGRRTEETTASADHVARPSDGWFYEVVWRNKVLAASTPATASAPGRWLILADGRGFGEALDGRLRSAGGAVTLVSPAGQEAKDLAALLRSEGGSPPLRGIVHLWGLNLSTSDPATSEELARAQRLTCGSVLHLLHALAGCKAETPPRLWIVTRGAQSVLPQPTPLTVAQSPVWGLANVLALEHPELRCARIDLDPAPSDDEARMLLAELTGGDGEDQVAFRDGERWVARLVRATLPPLEVSPYPLRADATYLITGGLTGLGFAVGRWMVEQQGARHLVLMGRRPPSSATAEAIQKLEQAGARVVVAQADVANEADLRRVVEGIERSHWPLRGVVHSAGVIDDAILLNQDWSRFERVMAPKIAGAWNLHRLTRNAGLDFFVLFSSAAALLGSPGQGNYAAANAFLDGLAHHRRALGLPGLSINWGPWGEVGAVVDRSLEKRVAFQGVRAIAPRDGLRVLGQLLDQKASQICVISLNWERVLTQVPNDSPYYQELHPPAARVIGVSESVAAALPDLRERLAGHPANRRGQLLLQMVTQEAAKILGLDPSRHIDPDRPLQELGLDSLMALELRNKLGGAVGQTLSATLLFDHPTLAELVKYLVHDVLSLPPAAQGRCDVPNSASTLTQELEDLSEDETAAILASRLDAIDRKGPR